MRRRITFVSLLFAFFTSSTVVFGAPAKGRPTWDNRDFLRLSAAPNEIIVKFKSAAATTLEEETSVGPDAAQLPAIPLAGSSLDKLSKRFRLRDIKPGNTFLTYFRIESDHGADSVLHHLAFCEELPSAI